MVGPSLPWVDPLVDPALTLTSQTLHVPVTVMIKLPVAAGERGHNRPGNQAAHAAGRGCPVGSEV